MALLKVYKNKTPVQELLLDPNQVYLAGRREDCSIRLDPEPGISREHFQISYGQDGWRIEVLSRYGEFYVGGEKSPSFTTQVSQHFSVSPYDFELIIDKIENESSQPDYSGNESQVERTMLSAMPAAAVLKVVDETGRIRQKFRLEGSAWIAGRDVSCALFIDNPKISRKQFEIFRDGNEYKIRDLNSANGTTVNNHSISSKDWTLLESGDIIGVVDWTVVFELLDASFTDRVKGVNPEYQKPLAFANIQSDLPQAPPPPLEEEFGFGAEGGGHTNYEAPPEENPDAWSPPQFQVPPNYTPPQIQTPFQPQFQSGAAVGGGMMGGATSIPNQPLNSEDSGEKNKKKNNITTILIGLIVVGMGAYAYFEYFAKEELKPKAVVAPVPEKPKSPFERLSLENQQLILNARDNTAKMLQRQEFDKVLGEINRAKEKVLDYKDPILQEREMTAKAGLEQLARQREEEEAERQRVENEKKIITKVDECRSKIKLKTVTIEWVDTCLSEVTPLLPNHPGIEALHAEVDRIVTERKIKEDKKAEFQADAKKLQIIYNKAVAIDKPNRAKEAVEAYEHVIKAKHVDPHKFKEKSRNRIDEILGKIAAEQAAYEKEAEQYQKEGNLKMTAKALQKALDVDPDNEVVKGHLKSVIFELSKTLQLKYQESILQESMGEVDGAKQKWKDIIDKSIPSENYYEKSRLKLKKYGEL